MRAFRAAAGPNTWLVMAGEGDLRPVVEAAAQGAENIKLIGYRTDVARLYQAYDLLAFPSREEQMPMVLLEAMAMSRPVVSTSVGSIPDVLADGTDGLLVPPADASALAVALERLVADGRFRRGAGAAGRAKVVNGYSAAAMHDRIFALYAASDPAR